MSFRIFLTIVFGLILYRGTELRGQDAGCGTVPTETQLKFMGKIHEIAASARTETSDALIRIPVQFYMVARNDGTGVPSYFNPNAVLDRLNTYYRNANMSFFFHQSPVIVNSTNLFDYNSSQERELSGPRNLGGVINIYFTNSITSNGIPLCGYTYFPPSADHVFVAYNCTNNNTTLEHEIGHYFTLFHTHGKTNRGTTDELVNGSNCTTAGDDICDTPADPNLTNNVSNCAYTGAETDQNGQRFQPDVRNIMSYAPSACRDRFSPGQYERIRRGFELGRSYLLFQSDDLVANFTQNKNNVCIGDLVSYEVNSFGATRWNWEFEGGTPSTSTARRPNIRYNSEGTFRVKLTVFNAQGTSTTLVRENLIEATNPLTNAINDSLMTDFQTLPQEIREIINPDQSITFSIAPYGRFEGNALFVDNFNYFSESMPNKDYLVLDYYNNEGIRAYTVSFDYAYTYRTAPDNFLGIGTVNIFDSLGFGISSSCAFNPDVFLWKRGGLSLQTTQGPSDVAFFPENASQWQSVSLNYNPGNTETTTFFLENTSFNGNNVFIDNLKILPDYRLNSPTNFRIVSFSNGLLTLRWIDNASNDVAYIVEQSLNDQEFIAIDTLPRNSQIYTRQITEQGILKYRIRAMGIKGFFSPYSPVVSLNAIVSLNDPLLEERNQGIELYPNPASHKFYVKVPQDLRNVHTMDVTGRSINKTVFMEKEGIYEVEITESFKGILLVQLEWMDGSISTKKMIVY
ncbi:MAG: PKD domain-containing protein [Cyclobacteriaceae bacterium]|nr:PKD domain-containing protein [Cyclobacteriaceae bacterium]